MALHVMDEANQCLGCKKPRCQQGCPIQTNIPEVIRLLKANKLDEAGRMLPERCLSRKAGIVWYCPYLSLQAVWRRSVILPASFCPIWREYQNLRLTLRFRHPDVKLLTRVYCDKHM